MSERASYDELCAYTLTHGGAAFIHQHVVDAFTAQTADERTKPIALTFALAGLYLHVERQFSGREVQQAHQRLARRKQTWPSFVLPRDAAPSLPGCSRSAVRVWSAMRHTCVVRLGLGRFPRERARG
jgi:hypothetical protein